MIKPSDPRLKENVEKAAKKVEVEKKKEEKKRVNPLPASLFLSHNESLGPPYRVLVDTNFINFSLQNKIELVQGMMDCLMAKCEWTTVQDTLTVTIANSIHAAIDMSTGIPTITDCVLAELEKLGPRYRMALKSVLTTRRRANKHEESSTELVTLSRCRVARDPRFDRLPCSREFRPRFAVHRCTVRLNESTLCYRPQTREHMRTTASLIE